MDVKEIKGAMRIEKNGENVGQLHIDGVVGYDYYGDAWDAGYFKRQLENLGAVDRIEVFINSPGGSVTDGISIMNALVRHEAPVDVYVDGMAASIASVIAMAADPGRLFMPDNTFMFIHDPWTYAEGNADEFRKTADELDKFRDLIVASYRRHFALSDEEIRDAMKAETMLPAEACADLCGAIVTGTLQAAACIQEDALAKLPEEVQAKYAELLASLTDTDDDADDSGEPAEPPSNQVDDDQPANEPPADDPAPDSDSDDNSDDSDGEPSARAPQLSAIALADLPAEARKRIEDEVKAELLLNWQGRFDAYAAQLEKANDLIAKHQSEKDKAHAELETVKAQNETLSAKLSKLTRGGLSFHQEINSWEEALKACDGDYVKARKTHPNAYKTFMDLKRANTRP